MSVNYTDSFNDETKVVKMLLTTWNWSCFLEM